MKQYTTFRDFYPFYASQHRNATSRYLHAVGSLTSLGLMAYAIVSAQWLLILAAIVVPYAFAWTGHFVFEKNKPATFTYPLYSFLGDWVMLWQTLTGRFPAPRDQA